MDHHHSPIRSVLARDQIGCSQAFALLILIVMAMFAIGESGKSDIECLRSIKNSLQDPQKSLSSWVFNNSSESGDGFICSFNGVDCWDSNRVFAIRISGMGLRGEFPRGIANCTSLVELDLSNNHLYGSIPSDISTLLQLAASLDLSHNKFTGEIPSSIALCSNLYALELNDNLLSGQIPPLLGSLQRLNSFTVASNHLSGPVPIFLNASFSRKSYANNAGLCGYPLDPCKSGKVQQNLFVGGFFAGWGISFTLVLVVGGWFSSFRDCVIYIIKRKLTATPRNQSVPLSQRKDNTMILERFATRMSFLELRHTTNNFSQNNVIAIGEMGITYKAMLPNGCCLAIKRLSSTFHTEHEFLSEIMTLGRLRHRNLVPLFGFCQESNDRFLVYRSMPQGSLHDFLFSSEGETKIMEWPLRAKIAVGTAKGIAWLHQNGIVHRGINSKCILLDEDLNPRISDFGRATTLNRNYSGWELSFHRELSVLGSYEEDVHCFGKVLLELITGIKYNKIISSFDIDADMSEQMSHWINEAGPPGICVQSMMEGGFDGEISGFLSVAAKCLECDPCNWPSMEEVHRMLIGKRRDDALDGCDTSFKKEVGNTLISRLDKFATRMSLLELDQATDNFSENNVVAIGEMGTTYKAMLSNGRRMAIKRLSNAPHIEHAFLSEIITLGRLRHRNLVPFFGFFHESNNRYIIYDFMPKGSLHDCLFSCKGEAKILEWPMRAKIAVGIAKGIAWLHLNGVVHRGISSECILLDEDFNPKIADCGKATTLNHNYSSWELSVNREFSALGSYEEDVHSFGKVLLELITGKNYEEIIRSFDFDADMFEQISHLLNEAGLPGACVQSMMEQGFRDEISRFLSVAARCLECDPCNWPGMEEVYQMLVGKNTAIPLVLHRRVI